MTVQTLTALPGRVSDEQRRQAEAFLVEQASEHDPATLRRLGRHLRHALDPDAGATLAAEETATAADRDLSVGVDVAGRTVLRWRLDPVGAATVLTVLSPLAAPCPAIDGTPDPRPAGRRRADALLQIVEASLRSGDLPAEGGQPTRVTVTVDLETLEQRLRSVGGGLDWAGAISAETARMLACDAQLIRSCWAPTASRSTSAGPPTPRPQRCAGPCSPATAAARSRVATGRPAGATCTTPGTGPTAAGPRSPTSARSVAGTTTPSTTTAGRSASVRTATRSSSRHPGSTPPSSPASPLAPRPAEPRRTRVVEPATLAGQLVSWSAGRAGPRPPAARPASGRTTATGHPGADIASKGEDRDEEAGGGVPGQAREDAAGGRADR